MPRIIAEHIDQYREENGIVKCYKVGELIRCKECMWLGDESYDDVYWCELHNTDTIESNYCSWAERKRDEREQKQSKSCTSTRSDHN